jgi:hypothetical protein
VAICRCFDANAKLFGVIVSVAFCRCFDANAKLFGVIAPVTIRCFRVGSRSLWPIAALHPLLAPPSREGGI